MMTMINWSGAFDMVIILLLVSVSSCASEKYLGEEICGYYYVSEHCENTEDGILFGDNLISFSLDESSRNYWASVPTPMHLWGKDVAVSKMIKMVVLEGDSLSVRLKDDISGFWSGTYNVEIMRGETVKRMIFFNKMRRVVVEEVTLKNYGSSICSGCKYETLRCD